MNEPVFTTTNVATGGFGSVKAQFVVNKSGIPPGFVNNPVYTQPLYASNCVCQLDLAPFDTLIWPHLAFVAPAGADASV